MTALIDRIPMQILLEMSVFLLKNIRQQSGFQSLLEEEKKKI